MTIAVALKIGDGLILGADSAATLAGTTHVSNVYFNAEKLFNVVKGWPLGAVTYGLGGLDGRSIYNLAKELRERLTGKEAAWRLELSNYTIEAASQRLRDFFYEYYSIEYQQGSLPPGEYPEMGFLIGGYSAQSTQPEIWSVSIGTDGLANDPSQLAPASPGASIHAEGQSEAAARVLRGWSPTVLQGLVDSGVPLEEATEFLENLPYEPLMHPAMPLQDGIDLVRYVIEIQIGFVRFTPMAPSVSAPIDLAAITEHEGFRWIERKHWFSRKYNLPPSSILSREGS